MKVLIVTMHRGQNYGSALQTYAISERLKDAGHEPVILDYIPSRIRQKNVLTGAFKQLVSLKSSSRERYNALRGILINISSEAVYNKFFNRHVSLTRKYYSLEELIGDRPQADVFMTGSDQVWNSFHNQGLDKVFFLAFTSDHHRRVSYAASFGKTELDAWEIPETEALLKRYQAISVRESSGLNILKALGIAGGGLVLDPTLLLSDQDWAARCPRLPISEKYLLIYSVEPNKGELILHARRIARELGLKIYLVEWGFKKRPGVDKTICLPSPLELMSYFLQADFVVASSFHGTAISVNLNKQFISISPERFNTRVMSLLELVGLTDRMMENDQKPLAEILSRIDFAHANQVLAKNREASYSFLLNSIEKQ